MFIIKHKPKPLMCTQGQNINSSLVSSYQIFRFYYLPFAVCALALHTSQTGTDFWCCMVKVLSSNPPPHLMNHQQHPPTN